MIQQLANPLVVVDWKGAKIENDSWPDFRYSGKFLCIDDNALLFLIHMVSKILWRRCAHD